MHEISPLWMESPFTHTGTAHALQEAQHLLLILEDEFSRKTFFSCLKLPQKDAQLVSATACSLGESCSPRFISHRTDLMAILVPQRTCTVAAGNAHSRHRLQKLQECWPLRKELLTNQLAPTADMGTTLGPKCTYKNVTELPQQYCYNQ